MKILGTTAKSILVLASIITIASLRGYAEDYDKFEIKYGMHEETVKEKYGQPLLVKQIKIHPIPSKKALYKIGDSDYMTLHFFSGRIQKITLLHDTEEDAASTLFNID